MDDLVADRLQITLSLISPFLSVLVYRQVEGSEEFCAHCWVALLETSVCCLGLWLIFQAEKGWQLLLWLDESLYINRVDRQAEVPHASNPSGIVISLLPEDLTPWSSGVCEKDTVVSLSCGSMVQFIVPSCQGAGHMSRG